MNNIVNGVIQVLDQLKNSGQLNSYLIDDDERKWTKLVYDIMINKFDMPFGNSTMQQASWIFNNAVRIWKGKNKLDNMMNMESRNMNKKLIRLTESDLHRIVKESVNRILKESDYVSSGYADKDGEIYRNPKNGHVKRAKIGSKYENKPNKVGDYVPIGYADKDGEIYRNPKNGHVKRIKEEW